MAIGDNLTLVKTEVGIPWYKAFGVMQHLTPATARTMLQIPWYAWEDNGIETRLQITRIPVQPTQYSRGPMISVGLSNIGGIGAKVQNGTTIIEQEGNISANCETQCLESSFGSDVELIVYGGHIKNDTVSMYFYTNQNNEIYVGLSYGVGGNMTTAFEFLYSPKDNPSIVRDASTSFNNYTYPSNDKNLYCDGNVIEQYFACTTLSNLYKACSFDFKVSCKMFATRNGLEKFKDTGDDSEEIEAITNTNPGEDRTTVLFLEAQEYKSEFSIRQPNEKVGNKKRIEFYVRNTKDTGEKIQYIDRAVWGFVHNDSVKPAKHELLTPSNIYNGKEARGDATRHINLENTSNMGCLWRIPVSAGDILHITANNTGLKAWYVLMDSNNVLINYDNTWKNLPFTMSVTQNCFICFNVHNADDTPFDFSDYQPSVYTLDGGRELTDYKNITFVRNNAFEVYKILENGVDITRSYDWSRRFTVWKNNVLYNGEYYWANIVTNMFIFETYQKGLDAIQSGIIDGLLSDTPIPDTVPTPLADNEIDYDGGMSETFLLTKESINQLADRLTIEVSADGSILRNMFVGLSMHNNPVDVVIDLFALPIDVTDFVTTEVTKIDFNPRTRTTSDDSGDTPPSNT